MEPRRDFTQHDIHKFSLGSFYCLVNPRCNEEFQNFLKNTRRTSHMPTLYLFNKARTSNEYKEEEFNDLLDRVDEFNSYELHQQHTDEQKLKNIVFQCSTILDKTVYNPFITFLKNMRQ